MKNALRVVLTVGASTALLACGGGQKIGSNPEAAGSALYYASSAANEDTGSSGGGLSASGLEVNGEATVKCKLSGQVKLKANASVGPNAIELEKAATYEGCANITYDDPSTPGVEKDAVVLDGTLTLTNKLSAGFIGQTLKGKVNFGGAFNDFVEADVEQSLELAKLTHSTGALTIKYTGKISTSEETHELQAKNITVTAGKLSAATRAEIEAKQ